MSDYFNQKNTPPSGEQDDVFVDPGRSEQENGIDWEERSAQPPVQYPAQPPYGGGYYYPPTTTAVPPPGPAGQGGYPLPYSVQAPPGQGYPPQGYPAPGYPPQGGYPNQGYPPQGHPYYGSYPQQPYPQPPKRKMSMGLKVFLFVFSFLFVGTVLGFCGALIYNSTIKTSPSYEDFYNFDGLLPEQQPTPAPAPGEAPKEEIEQPDIEVLPNSEGLSLHSRPSTQELTAKEAYDKVLKSTVSVEAKIPGANSAVQTSMGSGLFITADGFIITNGHVVGYTKGAGVTVTTSDGNEYPAVVVGYDRATDLAVLKAEGQSFTPAEIGNSDELSIGEWVVAIGNPGGDRFTGSLTRGVISGLDRAVGYEGENAMTYIQTDAAINPGNSGGPLANMYGQVIGINTSKIVADYYEGMGFAIPVSQAKKVIDDILLLGHVQGRVRLGITCRDISQEEYYYGGYPTGIIIESIGAQSSFAGTSAQVGDIITALDGETIPSLSVLSGQFTNYKPGDQVEVTLYRPNQDGAGSEFTVKITLLEDKGETQKAD